jgi:hypothetical protein
MRRVFYVPYFEKINGRFRRVFGQIAEHLPKQCSFAPLYEVFCCCFTFVALLACQGINKVLKNKDPQYKLRMAEQYFAKKKYSYAQQLYEDVMPFFKAGPEFEDIYYKYAYTRITSAIT